jgi:hypothetical protein
MEDRPETPAERLQRRRGRRWKRRGRIIAPFVGVPLLLATLLLSVDIVEYNPQESRDRLVDRPITLPAQRSNARSQPADIRPVALPSRLEPSPVRGPEAAPDADFLPSKDNSIDSEVAPVVMPLPKPPAPPHGTSRY